ncbi:hypothetical protein BST91_12505 [Nonlabens tegetincola]|nr:hypothetical protein BST91_12505 [Nonlabens tegetincola]PQJ18947.1 hypothetical protein BST93_03980 [Nonlabens tegetincola]
MMKFLNKATMKHINKIFALAAIMAVAFSCVEDDEYEVPDTRLVDIEDPSNIVTIGNVVSQIDQSQNGTVTFDTPGEFMEGYVISSDEAGNFFEEIVIQDAPENPTVGIKVLIDNSPLFTTYEFGRRIFVKLDGLTAGISNGVPVIGIAGSGTNIEKIAPSQQEDFILRDDIVAEIVPTVVTPSDFATDKLNTYIVLDGAQFSDEDVANNRSFAAEATDQFDGLRFLQSCTDFFAPAVRLETSTFSDFKAASVPGGSGSVTAILSRDFEDDNFVIVVNGPADFDFDPNVRCDFDVVSCGLVGAAGATTILSENFETQSTGQIAQPAGWTNFIEAGTETWEVYSAGGTNASLGNSVRVGSFRSNDTSTISWLITPQIDFDAQTGEVFDFETSNSFADGSEMQVLYSADWDGTTAGITTATWEALADPTIVEDSEFFGNWVPSGFASLDCLTGTGYIAFKYEGSGDAGFDGTYELDNIRITSN